MPVEIQIVGGTRRSVYRQLDNSIELADSCKCQSEASLDCPIDDHKIAARMLELVPHGTTVVS